MFIYTQWGIYTHFVYALYIDNGENIQNVHSSTVYNYKNQKIAKCPTKESG